ncbi:unnamed protein product [Alternaria alternata]
MKEDFPESRWFMRGWTLQELLAPTDVIFYDSEWAYLGAKSKHAQWISDITGIDKNALFPRYDRHLDLSTFCVAQKMSWASQRQTTREEDIAYCLLGIFNINMPLLYGEGNQAFRRLQEEIIRKTDDDSILAWGLEPRDKLDHSSKPIVDTLRSGVTSFYFLGDLLARSPKDFVNCWSLRHDATSTSPFTLTNTGLHIRLPLVAVSELDGDADSIGVYGWIGLLRCSTTSSPDFLGILLCPETDDRFEQKSSPHSHNSFWIFLPYVQDRFQNGTSVQRFDRGHRQVLVNVSQAVKDLHFKVESGTAWNIAEEIHGYNQEWDAGPAILTIKGEKRFKDIFQFRFTNDHGVEFSIFMRTISSRTIVQGGHTFSKSERFDFYQDLEQSSSRYNAEKFAIYGLLGQPLFVRVEVHEKRVYDHRLFELNVDAVGTL